MISAIGTVLFWMTAAAIACVVLFLACILLIGFCSFVAMLCGRQPYDPHEQRRSDWIANTTAQLAAMTPEQRRQWANREGPYADA